MAELESRKKEKSGFCSKLLHLGKKDSLWYRIFQTNRRMEIAFVLSVVHIFGISCGKKMDSLCFSREIDPFELR